MKILKKQQKDYKLLILNTCLCLGIISLICLDFYKLALIGFVYLLIKNNSLIKEKFDDYLVQKDRFNKYYKKRFPILFYVLPIIGILSGLGVLYTGYLLNDIFYEIFLENVHFLSCKQEIQSLQFSFTVFSITFFSYAFIDVVIAIYVIQKASAPGDSEPLLDESEGDMDMSDEEFEQKQADVSENSPGKKARKDPDLTDARRRGLGKGKKT